MILTKKVKFKINGAKIKYYKNLGYEVPHRNFELEIDIKDLSNGSNILVECKCDICFKELNIKYQNYNKYVNNQGYYTCNKCSDIKKKETKLEKYGDKNYNNMSKNKETKLEKYGNENYNNHDKYIKTCLEKYGVESSFQNEKTKNKIKETNNIRFGVDNPTQSHDILLKSFKSGHKVTQFKETNIYYQGSYELDFLEKYYNSDVKRCNSIKYLFEEKKKIYFPDFYIEKLNLIVEIKSKYTYNLHKERNIEKQKACENIGYKFLFIIDKDYSEFEKLIK